jgi:hypothetical protein
MQLFDEVLDVQEVVMDASLLYEGALALRDNVPQDRRESVSHKLGENLGKAVDEADRSIVRDGGGIRLLGDENDVGGVDEISATPSEIGHVKNRRRDVVVDDVPTRFEESADESIRARRFDRGQRENGIFDLLNAESKQCQSNLVESIYYPPSSTP